MSAATNNFFGVLGEDPASGPVHLNEMPKTSQSTSSRKSDVNPRADPAKARKRAPGAPSNDKVFKDSTKDAGRNNNRKVPVKEGAKGHQSRRADRTDRVPRSGQRDTARRERSGWGDENTDASEQAYGAEIAKEDKLHDAEEDAELDTSATPEERKLTLEEFQKLQKEQSAGLNTRGAAVSTAGDNSASAAQQVAKTLVPEPRKKNTTKGRKDVETLSLGSNVFPSLKQSADGIVDPSARREAPRQERRAPRGGKPAAKGGKGGKPAPKGKKDSKDAKDTKEGKPAPKGKKASSKAAINLSNLPKLN